MIRVAFCRRTLRFVFELLLPQEYALSAPKDAYLSK